MALPSRIIPISPKDSSQTGNARRQADALAFEMGFDELRRGQLGIIVTEAARNIESHAGEGEIVLSAWTNGNLAGVDVLALDKGKGIESVSAAMQDGYSTAGTPGNGLGAISRLAGTFQIYTVKGDGTAVLARVLSGSHDIETESQGYPISTISVPIAGETICGDAWSVELTHTRSLFIVADGLGHGPVAAEAALESTRVFHEVSRHQPEQILREIHDALGKTRGAAVSIAEVLPEQKLLNYVGAGNIVGAIASGGRTRSLVSMNGTVGHSVGKLQTFSYPWEQGSVLIMHSDGLGTRWNVEQYPGLISRHPGLLTGVLFRDFSRRRDDATILAARL